MQAVEKKFEEITKKEIVNAINKLKHADLQEVLKHCQIEPKANKKKTLSSFANLSKEDMYAVYRRAFQKLAAIESERLERHKKRQLKRKIFSQLHNGVRAKIRKMSKKADDVREEVEDLLQEPVLGQSVSDDIFEQPAAAEQQLVGDAIPAVVVPEIEEQPAEDSNDAVNVAEPVMEPVVEEVISGDAMVDAAEQAPSMESEVAIEPAPEQ